MASWITDTKDLISAIGYVKLNLVKTGAKPDEKTAGVGCMRSTTWMNSAK